MLPEYQGHSPKANAKLSLKVTPPKINMEPELDALEDDFPF